MHEYESSSTIRQTKMEEIRVEIAADAKEFRCPLCGKKLKVPDYFANCPCGEWVKTVNRTNQAGGWGKGEEIAQVSMLLQREPPAEKMTPQEARAIFMGMLTSIHHEKIGLKETAREEDGR